MQIRMEGRSALITGGSRGLGRAMALKFAQAGAKVAILARRPGVLDETKREIEAAAPGAKIKACPCDVSDPGQIRDAFQAVVRDFGQVDILVNNAGTSVRGKFEELTDEVWMEDFNLKLFAAVRLCRLALPGMKERRWGRIINVLNTAAKAPAGEGAPTAVTRAAGMAMTKVLSKEAAPYNVLVNALCVGRFVTDQWLGHHKKQAPEKTFEQYMKDMGKTIPLGRVGDAEEFASVACFLASDAGSYVSGVAINVDGGASPVV